MRMDKRLRRAFLIFAPLALLAGGWAGAQEAGSQADALVLAKQQAEEAKRRSGLLEKQAARATDEAARARAGAAALASRIEAAEADITAADARIRLIESLRAQQRARLAERQGPVIRLTAALQTMGRRPPALALVQPGSLDELTHVRALLASTLPAIRARTADLRAEVERGNDLRRQADRAVLALKAGQADLRQRRIALAAFEERQRSRSENLMQSAVSESDRALAFGEEARELATLASTREFQNRLRRRLAELPGPVPRPGSPAIAPGPPGNPRYRLPVEGRIVTGMGEISDAGVHARGLTFAAAAGSPVVAPAQGRVVYAGRFRGYGEIVIIDHGGGWVSTLTNLASLEVKRGDRLAMGAPLGRAGRAETPVTIELRHNGRPFPIAPLLSFG
jgi:septal ring factor EnvC (AmiA/AmiB activator)